MEEILKKFDLVPTDLYMIVAGALLFVVFWRTFGKLVVQPFATLIEAREQATVGADETANSKRAKAGELVASYEARITDERVKAMRIKFEAVNQAKTAAAKVVADAESVAQEKVKKARAETEKQLQTLRQQALREADGLAQIMADKARSAFSLN